MYEYREKVDLFAPKPLGSAILIPVNGNYKKNGDAVMGSGIAKLAVKKYPAIKQRWGRSLERQGRPMMAQSESALGNHVDVLWARPPIIAFPTKWNFWERADMQLVERSAAELVKLVEDLHLVRVYMPRVGCGDGGLNWHREVRPMLYNYLDARFHVCYFGEEEAP